MHTSTLSAVILVGLLSGCATTETVDIDATPPSTADYNPGFTGYTVGYDGYGNYNDGYGPSFWNPRYYFYTGYSHGYPGRE